MSAKPVFITRAAIRSVSQGACRAALRPLGFHSVSPNFWRAREGELRQAILFQTNKYHRPERGSFTINLGVSVALPPERMGGRPTDPGFALWPIQQRIGSVMSARRDIWWEVDTRTDVEALGLEIARTLLDCAIPFFERYATSRIFDADPPEPFGRVHPHSLAVARGGLAALRGDMEGAAGFFRSAMSGQRSDPLNDRVRRLSTALAIDLNAGSRP